MKAPHSEQSFISRLCICLSWRGTWRWMSDIPFQESGQVQEEWGGVNDRVPTTRYVRRYEEQRDAMYVNAPST